MITLALTLIRVDYATISATWYLVRDRLMVTETAVAGPIDSSTTRVHHTGTKATLTEWGAKGHNRQVAILLKQYILGRGKERAWRLKAPHCCVFILCSFYQVASREWTRGQHSSSSSSSKSWQQATTAEEEAAFLTSKVQSNIHKRLFFMPYDTIPYYT